MKTLTPSVSAVIMRPLGRRELRVPDVEDQHDSQLVAVVPRFVLDRVVEHPRPAGDPLTRVVSDPESAAFRE